MLSQLNIRMMGLHAERTQSEQFYNILLALARIASRIISASTYTFNSDIERAAGRGNCLKFFVCLLYSNKYYASFYLNTLIESVSRAIGIYIEKDYANFPKRDFINVVLEFFEKSIPQMGIKI